MEYEKNAWKLNRKGEIALCFRENKWKNSLISGNFLIETHNFICTRTNINLVVKAQFPPQNYKRPTFRPNVSLVHRLDFFDLCLN